MSSLISSTFRTFGVPKKCMIDKMLQVEDMVTIVFITLTSKDCTVFCEDSLKLKAKWRLSAALLSCKFEQRHQIIVSALGKNLSSTFQSSLSFFFIFKTLFTTTKKSVTLDRFPRSIVRPDHESARLPIPDRVCTLSADRQSYTRYHEAFFSFEIFLSEDICNFQVRKPYN